MKQYNFYILSSVFVYLLSSIGPQSGELFSLLTSVKNRLLHIKIPSVAKIVFIVIHAHD